VAQTEGGQVKDLGYVRTQIKPIGPKSGAKEGDPRLVKKKEYVGRGMGHHRKQQLLGNIRHAGTHKI